MVENDSHRYAHHRVCSNPFTLAGVDPKVASDQRGHGIGVSLEVYTSSDLEQKRGDVKQLEAAVLRKQKPQSDEAQAESGLTE